MAFVTRKEYIEALGRYLTPPKRGDLIQAKRVTLDPLERGGNATVWRLLRKFRGNPLETAAPLMENLRFSSSMWAQYISIQSECWTGHA